MINEEQLRDRVINEIRHLRHTGSSREEILAAIERFGFVSQYNEELIDYVDRQEQLHGAELRLQGSEAVGQAATMDSRAGIGSSIAQHPKKSPHRMLIGVIIFIIVFFVAFFLLINTTAKKEDTLQIEYNTVIAKNSYNSGEPLALNTAYSFKGRKTYRQVEIRYRLLDSNQDIAFEKVENTNINMLKNTRIEVQMPSDLPLGEYYLFSELNYGENKVATSRTDRFEIVEQTKETSGDLPDETKTEMPDQSQPVSSQTPGSVPEPTPTKDSITAIPDASANTSGTQSDSRSGDEIYEANVKERIAKEKSEREFMLSTIEDAKNHASNDPQKAGEICRSLQGIKIIDNCFLQASKKAGNYAFCSEIIDVATRDYCYMSYVINSKDYTRCEEIIFSKTRNSCYTLNPNYSAVDS